MPDDYTREVLRDAIPLLEQLLERLKVLAGMPTSITLSAEACAQLRDTLEKQPPMPLVIRKFATPISDEHRRELDPRCPS